jgi:hypothetical protein
MPKGSAGVPSLQLETLNGLVSKLDKNPNLFFANMFPEARYPSDSIRWEVEYGSAGLTPFVAPGSVSPKIGLDGIGEGSAKAAYMKEAIFFDEVFLNNIRQVGTYEEYATAERSLAKGLRKLRNRVDRRREWMMANAIVNNGFSYTAVGGTKISVSYGLPATHNITLGSTRHWTDGASKDILEDVLEWRRILAEDAGVTPDYVMLNSKLLYVLMTDTAIQGLLEKSAFGNGDLFTNPEAVIGQLLGVGTLKTYDEFTETEQYLAANVVAATTTTITVPDARDIEVGSTARFYDVSENNVWEDATVSSVDIPNNQFDISAVTTLGFKANEDMVRFRKKTIADNEFMMFSSRNADGEMIAEDMLAPFGLERSYGVYVDQKEEWDPDGIVLRIQNKSLPVVYHPDCILKATVHD